MVKEVKRVGACVGGEGGNMCNLSTIKIKFFKKKILHLENGPK